MSPKIHYLQVLTTLEFNEGQQNFATSGDIYFINDVPYASISFSTSRSLGTGIRDSLLIRGKQLWLKVKISTLKPAYFLMILWVSSSVLKEFIYRSKNEISKALFSNNKFSLDLIVSQKTGKFRYDKTFNFLVFDLLLNFSENMIHSIVLWSSGNKSAFWSTTWSSM